MRIFVSSACARRDRIADSVKVLAEAGFHHIELTGGSDHYSNIEQDLIALREEFGLSYIVHNYFPPPEGQHFVLNLASLDDSCWRESLDHCKRAISLAARLGVDRYGVHAGFLLDLKASEIGSGVARRTISDRADATARFAEAYRILKNESSEVELYVENNVLSEKNFASFETDPFLMTDYEGYLELNEACDGLNLLLDLAHLKVSCHSLSLNFANESAKLLEATDYLHVSENNGRWDANEALVTQDSTVSRALTGKVSDKVITCEVYAGLKSVSQTIDTLHSLNDAM